MNYKHALYEQLARDMGCTVEEIAGDKNLFLCTEKLPGARNARWHRISKLNLICIRSKIVARSEDPELIAWLRDQYAGFAGQWLSYFPFLRQLDGGLRQFGVRIGDFSPFFIPDEVLPEPDAGALAGAALTWYDQQEILQFQDDPRFSNAILFDPFAPDMVAVTAERDGRVIAMAAANADSSRMWQIGVDVLPDSRGRGIGAALVGRVRDYILDKGVLPYYGTAMSHIRSQRTAIRAGFIPAWAELYSEPMEPIDSPEPVG